MQICLWINPRGDSIAEEYKVGHHAYRIHRYHLTHAAEGRVLFLVVPYVAQRSTPVSTRTHQRNGLMSDLDGKDLN